MWLFQLTLGAFIRPTSMDTLSPYSQHRQRSMYERAWISPLVRLLVMNSEPCQSFSRSWNPVLNIPLTTVRQNMVTFTFYSHSKGAGVPVQAVNAYGKVNVQLHLFLTSELNGSWAASRSGGARWAPQLVSTFSPVGNWTIPNAQIYKNGTA